MFRHYSRGSLVTDLHLTTGVFVRYDSPNEKFAIEFNKRKPHNQIFNLLNGIVNVTDETLPTQTFMNDGEIGGFTAWAPEQRYEMPELPKCVITHKPDQVAELAGSR